MARALAASFSAIGLPLRTARTERSVWAEKPSASVGLGKARRGWGKGFDLLDVTLGEADLAPIRAACVMSVRWVAGWSGSMWPVSVIVLIASGHAPALPS